MPRHIHPNPLIIQPPDDLVDHRPDIRRLSQQLALKYANQQLVSEADLQTVGGALWGALEMDEVFARAHTKAGAAILPISIESAAAAVQALPWETLYHPQHGFLGRQPGFTLSRRLGTRQPAPPPLEKGPLRVLLFTALPDDLNPETSRLNVEEEQIQVQEALMPWISKGTVQLEMPDDGRFSTLVELLKKFQPHLLFLSGHGQFHHQPHLNEPPYGVFYFEGESGEGSPVRDDQLAQTFIGSGVQGVVLSACESGKAASDALNTGLAQRLSAQGVPHVIGMRESILDRAGIQFARALCDELAQGERFDYALQTARAAIQTPLKDIARRETGTSAQAELSLGQWCLPMLVSPNPDQPLIDWNFQPHEIATRTANQSIHSISLPARFIGRRAELRQYKSQMLKGVVQKLLITGAGGQGKTALGGKLAQDLLAHGDYVFAWSARRENSWRTFQFELERSLKGDFAHNYDRLRPQVESEVEHADLLLRLLLEQLGGRLVLFLDNLETLQDPDTLALNDARVAAWLQIAGSLPGVIVLATSRWQIPGWQGAHLPLAHTNYGDFLQMAQQVLPGGYLEKRGRLRQVYDILGGNGRGLEFFAAALRVMGAGADESAFLERLAKTKSEMQSNMAIETIVQHLPAKAQSLLARLPVYPQPVPEEGMIKLGLDLDDHPETLLERLLAVSLLEVQWEPRWEVMQYQCAPLVADWLRENQLADEAPRWLEAAADYQVYLQLNERHTLTQAFIAHDALRRAERKAQADRTALDDIVGPLSRAGFYHTLLKDWLPDICRSEDPGTRAEALNQTGKQMLSTGDYANALPILQQSLAIHQQIGDKSGEGTTLNNIPQIYAAQGDYATALSYLQKTLAIMQQIGDKAHEGGTLNNIAALYHAQGDYATALSYLQQSLAISQQIGDKAYEGATLNNIGNIYNAQGDYATALSYLQQSLAISQQIGDKSVEGTTLNNISHIFIAQGDYATALSYLQKTLAITQQIGDKAHEGGTLNNISQIYDAQGDYTTALSYLQQSLAISQQIGDKSVEGTTLNNISQIYDAQGDYATALSYLQQSLAISQQIGDKSGEGTTLHNISHIFKAQGDYATALSYLQQSLAIHQQIGDKSGEGATFGNIGNIYNAQGDYATALSYLQQSLAISQQIGDKSGEGTTLGNIGNNYYAQGDYASALSYLQQSLAISQQIGDKSGLCATLFNMGHIHAQNKEIQEAVSAWVTVYRIAKPMGLAQALQALAKLAPQLGMPPGLEGWEELAQKMGKTSPPSPSP